MGVQKHHRMDYTTPETYPFLSIVILQIVDGLAVPALTETEQMGWQEAVLSHDHEIGEESCQGLNHTNLTIGH